MTELDHLICKRLPQAITIWHDKVDDKDDTKRRQTMNIWDDLTILQHMEVVNYLTEQVERKFMVPIMMEHAHKPNSEHSSAKGEEEHGIQHVHEKPDKVTYHGEHFYMPKEAQLHGEYFKRRSVHRVYGSTVV